MNIQTLNQTIKTLEGLRNAVGSFTRADVDLTLGLLRREVEAPAEQLVIECDCETATSPDGSRLTKCGSDQMRRAVQEGHAFCKQPAQQEPVGEIGKIVMFGGDLKEVSWKNGKMPPAGSILYTRPQAREPEQPAQQEPVAWLVDNDYTTVFRDIAEVHRSKGVNVEPLYTSPQTSKPLTDEEIESINVRLAGSRDLARLFARAIEAAHGIKENT